LEFVLRRRTGLVTARRSLTRCNPRELRTFKMALLTLREEAKTFATSDELKLLLKSAAFASSVAQQPPFIIPPFTLNHPLVGVIRGHGRVKIDRPSKSGKRSRFQAWLNDEHWSGRRP